MNRNQRDRYESINKRNFRNALIHLLETEYKIIGSRKILSLLADDIEQLHSEYFVSTSTVGIGEIVFRTTADDGQRPNYGKKTEDYSSTTVVLPLVTEEDIENRVYTRNGNKNTNYEHCDRREIRTMIRLLESAKSQGGLLSGAEVSVLLNRSLNTIQKYLKAYVKETGKIPPLKGYVMDMGSLPTHKSIIISYYEQGMSPADIVLKTSHSQDAVDRYIKQYDQIKLLIRKGMSATEIKDIVRRSMKVVKEYIAIYNEFHDISENR